jgi:OmpA-OmpF porin, OOP family
MNRAIFLKSAKFLTCVAAVMPLGVMAQTEVPASSSSDSYNRSYRRDDASGRPWWQMQNNYWGFNLGAPRYDRSCAPGFACEDPDVGGKIYIGSHFNRWLGAEVGYVNFGKGDSNGGNVEAQGANLSLVGTLPLGDAFRVFGKVGTTYSWTKVDGTVGPTGKDDGFGLSYGAGLGFDLNPRTQMVFEWDRHELNYVNGESDVDMYSVGLKFRF